MPSKEEADKAIGGLNGVDLKGRPLTVNEVPHRPAPHGRRWRRPIHMCGQDASGSLIMR